MGTVSSGVYIIAEAGVNHNGSLDRAGEMIRVAAQAGADAVKFQTFKAERLVTEGAQKADYQSRTSGGDESQFEMLRRLELDMDAHRSLIRECKTCGVEFLSSPFDLEAIDQLSELGMEKWKIPSGEITNLPYLRKIGGLGQKVILSTGMADLEEIRAALNVVTQAGTDLSRITILHCNTEYPTPMRDVNLNAMLTIKNEFPGTGFGYSDHTQGTEIPVAAVALGARIIEKHFTLDKSLPGPDHPASLNPEELAGMIAAIRNVEVAMGSGKKVPSPSEKKNLPIARKSIVAACAIREGEELTPVNITVKRPGTGVSPMRWDEIIGRRADRPYQKDELIHA